MTEIIISIVSAIMAVVSTVIAGLAISQNSKLQKQSLTHENSEDMNSWVGETLLIMKELYIKFPDGKKKDEMLDILIKLSTNIDLGRLFFQNQISGDYKINKPEVFRGRRVLILDLLVLYYDIYKQNLQEKNKDVLWGVQRAFINEMIIFLKQNRNSTEDVVYSYIDHDNIIQIKNLDNENFRKFLTSDDIVKAIKEEGLKYIDLKKNTKKLKKTLNNQKK